MVSIDQEQSKLEKLQWHRKIQHYNGSENEKKKLHIP